LASGLEALRLEVNLEGVNQHQQ